MTTGALVAVLLVVLSCSQAQNCSTIKPNGWHLLPPPDSTKRTSGLLLAEVGTELFTMLTDNNFPYHTICNSTLYKVSNAEHYFPAEKLQQFPCSFYEEGELWTCPNSSCLYHTFLECGGDNSSEWRLSHGALIRQDQTGKVVQGSEGLVMVGFADSTGRDEMKFGTVCDDSFSWRAANLSCRYLGYQYAEDWGSGPENFRYIPESMLVEHKVQIIVDDVTCYNDSYSITDCEAKVLEGHDCSLNESLWLKCGPDNSTDPEWQLVGAGLYRMENRSHEIVQGGEGLLVVHFAPEGGSADQDWLYGTVCDDSFNSHAADLACKYLGYSHAEAWGSSPENYWYIPERFYEDYDLKILIDEVSCDDDTTNIMNCSAKVLEGHDCSTSENLWLRCGKEAEKDWELYAADLIRWNNRTGEMETGSEGLVIVRFHDKSNTTDGTQSGTVCDDSFNDHAANLSCQYLGYKYAEGWGSEPRNSYYVPLELLADWDVPILVDDLQCDSWATNIMECEAKVLQGNDCFRDENLWLKCSSEEEEEDEEQGLELDFGGAKITLNLDKIRRKWIF